MMDTRIVELRIMFEDLRYQALRDIGLSSTVAETNYYGGKYVAYDQIIEKLREVSNGQSKT